MAGFDKWARDLADQLRQNSQVDEPKGHEDGPACVAGLVGTSRPPGTTPIVAQIGGTGLYGASVISNPDLKAAEYAERIGLTSPGKLKDLEIDLESTPKIGSLDDSVVLSREQYDRLRVGAAQHVELIYEVSKKFEGETRHETALRYIREAEGNSIKEEEGYLSLRDNPRGRCRDVLKKVNGEFRKVGIAPWRDWDGKTYMGLDGEILPFSKNWWNGEEAQDQVKTEA